jgi:uncharacterized Zn-finger protein
MMETDIVYTEAEQVACEGNDTNLGHPRIFLALTRTEPTYCPYCGRTFIWRSASS